MTEFFKLLHSANVRYLLIGGQAMRLVGMPRYSMDWDLFLPPHDAENFEKLNELLVEELDMPVVPLGEGGENFLQTYQTRWGVIQFHLGLPGVPKFDVTEQRAVARKTEDGLEIRCLCLDDLLATKVAAARPQDQADITYLMELKKLGHVD